MSLAENFRRKLLHPLTRFRHATTLRYRKELARAYVRLSIFPAELYLRKTGPITVLIDNSVLGHGITHETAWIDTGETLWGGQIPVRNGHSARIPVHAPNSDDRVYREVRYLVGIAELAKRGHIKLVSSAELLAEAYRQPLGRFRGYDYSDLNVFEGVEMPSVDGHHFDARDPKAAQQKRLSRSLAQPFLALAKLLPKKSNLDAWHIHTAHQHGLHCFLAIDFPLSENFRRAQSQKDFPQLNTKLLLPSELAAEIQLRPIETFAISYQNSSWFVHPELHSPSGRRSSPRVKSASPATAEETEVSGTQSQPINFLPKVADMMGGGVNHGHDAVGIQYKDKSGQIHQLDMRLGDAMYLLSILKATQLNLDIPFPDDPRDPNAKPIRPSEREKGNV